MTTLPVQGQVLKWARKFRGLTEQQAAETLGVSVAELKKYESGKLAVTLGVFENFASKYRLPQATLFRLTPPEEPRPPTDFRTLRGRKPTASVEFRIALSNVRTLLHHYDQLIAEDDEFPSIIRITERSSRC
jgi:transcriptional regulator with XRE-family HTH domain